MSGGVDSSVAAALAKREGHDVMGVTLKLWGGESDSGCCSVSDVEDARRVAEQLGIDHKVFNMSEEFEELVVQPYVVSHQNGETPNPCIECNRYIKFDLLLDRTRRLGYDLLATGHHARVVTGSDGAWLERGKDRYKDQSYVLSMLSASQLERIWLPVGDLTKDEVREIARDLKLRTADKPDSQDVCFISSTTKREGFLSQRVGLTKAKLSLMSDGSTLGEVMGFETVTIGQRKGLGTVGDSRRRYVVDKDRATRTIYMGSERELMTRSVKVERVTLRDEISDAPQIYSIQAAAHGGIDEGELRSGAVIFSHPRRRIAPGQTIALYRGDRVYGSAIVAS